MSQGQSLSAFIESSFNCFEFAQKKAVVLREQRNLEQLGSNPALGRGAQDMAIPIHRKLPGKGPRLGGGLQNTEIFPSISKKSICEQIFKI